MLDLWAFVSVLRSDYALCSNIDGAPESLHQISIQYKKLRRLSPNYQYQYQLFGGHFGAHEVSH